MSIRSKQITIIAISIFILSLIGGLVYAYLNGFLTVSVDPAIIPKKIKITNISSDRFSISWITEGITNGSVIYGQQGKLDLIVVDDRDQLTGETNPYNTHHVTITNLNPSQTYQFKIRSGENDKLFDNNSEPFTITTAAQVSNQPASDLINGTVTSSNGNSAVGSIVYISMPGMSPLSTQVKKDGSWLINLSTAYNEQLTDYIEYDKELEIIEVLVQGDSTVSSAITTTAIKSPVPAIELGQTYDFTQSADLPNNKDDLFEEPEESASQEAELPEIFFLDDGEASETNDDSVAQTPSTHIQQATITNPAFNNEELNTFTPQFLGKGPAETLLNIKITSTTTLRGTTMIDSQGNWSYTSSQSLDPGTYTLEIEYYDTEEKQQKLTRKFIIPDSLALGGVEDSLPAFESTPSATIKPTPTPTPRAAMPSTSSGVPVSGVSAPTVIVLGLGVIMLGGGLYAKKMTQY